MKSLTSLYQAEKILEAHTETRVDGERVVFLDPSAGFAVTTDGRRLFASREGFAKAKGQVQKAASFKFEAYKLGVFAEAGTGRREEYWQKVVPSSGTLDRYAALDLQIPIWLNQLKARSKESATVYFYREAKQAGWSLVRANQTRQIAVNLRYFQPYAGQKVRLLIDFDKDVAPIAVIPQPAAKEAESKRKSPKNEGLFNHPWFGLVMPMKLAPDDSDAIRFSERPAGPDRSGAASARKSTPAPAKESPEPESPAWQAVRNSFIEPTKSSGETSRRAPVTPTPQRGQLIVGDSNKRTAISNIIVTPTIRSKGAAT